MTASRIMVIRHGEKPSQVGPQIGVDESGMPDPDDLSVRGWQRAGALVRFFAPVRGAAPPLPIETPDFLFAEGIGKQVTSLRAPHTLGPLSQLLEKSISTRFTKGEEEALAAATMALDGVVLIAWEHHAIVNLANILLGGTAHSPQRWPDERFDCVWVFEATGGGWNFHQAPQLVLPGDNALPMP